MRSALLVAMVAAAVLGGCAAEKQRVEKEDKISAARLTGKFRHDDPLVVMLSAPERAALERAGMMEPRPEGADDATGEGDDAAADEHADKSNMDAAGDVMMSVLSVGISLGMMAAPYLLF